VLRDRLGERPRVVAFVAVALAVLLAAAALVGVTAAGGERGAGTDQMATELRTEKAENERLSKRERQLSADAARAEEQSERADQTADELRDLKAQNRRLKRRQRRWRAGAANALRQANMWKRRYEAERRRGQGNDRRRDERQRR
jgi:outer membrane murein-binding lipoprotein Lpp